MIRKCLKVIGAVAAILVGVVAVYVIYLFTTYHRIADNLPLTVEQPAKKGTDVDALAVGTEYTVGTSTIGFVAKCSGYRAGSRRSGGVAPAGLCPDRGDRSGFYEKLSYG